MKVALITTVNHNVGDDFIREGILYLLNDLLGEFEPVLIHKHAPVTARALIARIYETGAPLWFNRFGKRLLERGSRYLDILPVFPPTDRVMNSDLVVQCGAPVYWFSEENGGAHENEWFGPLIRRRYDRVSDRVDFLSLGGGTCQPYFSDGSDLLGSAPCCEYIKEFHHRCLVTTVRDTLSARILERLGLPPLLIPCPSLFAMNRLNIPAAPPEYVAVNLMEQGGHFRLGQAIDAALWEKTAVDFVKSVQRETPVLLVCHDAGERELASRLLPGVPVFSGKTARDYLECYAKAVCYVGCRVHGGFATASFGTPAFVIGSDSRARMLEEIGLNSVFVNDAGLDVLMENYQDMIRNRDDHRERLYRVKSDAEERYHSALAVLAERDSKNRARRASVLGAAAT